MNHQNISTRRSVESTVELIPLSFYETFGHMEDLVGQNRRLTIDAIANQDIEHRSAHRCTVVQASRECTISIVHDNQLMRQRINDWQKQSHWYPVSRSQEMSSWIESWLEMKHGSTTTLKESKQTSMEWQLFNLPCNRGFRSCRKCSSLHASGLWWRIDGPV